jgi:addiction module HigA family antidote
MAKRRPKYEAFPPGDHIREEIEYRGWSQSYLAWILGRPVQVINQIINGRKAITAQTARQLEAALGTSAETWMNLETSYRLYIAEGADPQITVRARQSSRRKTSKKTAEDENVFEFEFPAGRFEAVENQHKLGALGSAVGMTGNAKKRKIKSIK